MNLGRVLIADQNQALRSILRAYLENAGNETVDACDADAAVGCARSELIDLVLLELMLPGRGGGFVLREIRAQRGVPIVLMSTLRVGEVIDLIGDADGYLQKPFRIADAMHHVAALLARPRRALISP